MAKILIDTDGTFAGTTISADGKTIENIVWAHFSLWTAENPDDSSVSMNLDVLEENEDGLMERKSLMLAGKDMEQAKIADDIQGFLKSRKGR